MATAETPAPRAWRQPTRGEHVCATCRGAACYGLAGAWYCQACAPAGFLPKDRETAR
jgi:hypothetical protein